VDEPYLLNYKNVQILIMKGARKVNFQRIREDYRRIYRSQQKKVDNTEFILDIINKLLDRAGYNMADLEARLEKINVKEVRKEEDEGAKDNGTLLIFNFRR
jgi:hypothetical protein